MCFISGMPALGPDGAYRPGTFQEEVALAWHNITRIATAAGYATMKIVYVQCVVADIDNYATLNECWHQQFPDVSTAPARFTFQAAALPFGCKIEIQAVAAHGDSLPVSAADTDMGREQAGRARASPVWRVAGSLVSSPVVSGPRCPWLVGG